MGWETLAMVGFQAVGAMNTMKQGKAQAEAIAREGEIAARSVADDTVRNAGRLTTSFLQSGLTLEGGPSDIIAKAFLQGRTDITRIGVNANTASKNTMNKARSQALDNLANSVISKSAFSSVGGVLDDITKPTTDWLGQKVGSIFDPSPTGPYKPYLAGL